MTYEDPLAYFRGWRDACEDCAKFMDNMASKAPPGLELLAEPYRLIAHSIRQKGETAMAMAEQTQEVEQ